MARKRTPPRERADPDTVARELRRETVLDLYGRARTQAEIARELGISQKTVSRDIELARAEHRERRLDLIEKRQALVLGRYEAISRAAWQGWERSQQPKISRRQETATGRPKGKRPAAPLGSKLMQESEEQNGDPRFLMAAIAATDKVAEILDVKPRARRGDEDPDDPGVPAPSGDVPVTPANVLLIPVVNGKRVGGD